jgi:hypothetical protein
MLAPAGNRIATPQKSARSNSLSNDTIRCTNGSAYLWAYGEECQVTESVFQRKKKQIARGRSELLNGKCCTWRQNNSVT